MAGFQLDLRDPALRAAAGLRVGTNEIVTKQSQWRREKRPVRDRAATRKLIMDAVAGSLEPMSRLQIAKALNRSKNPAIVWALNDLVDEGHLRAIPSAHWNGVLMYLYEVA